MPVGSIEQHPLHVAEALDVAVHQRIVQDHERRPTGLAQQVGVGEATDQAHLLARAEAQLGESATLFPAVALAYQDLRHERLVHAQAGLRKQQLQIAVQVALQGRLQLTGELQAVIRQTDEQEVQRAGTPRELVPAARSTRQLDVQFRAALLQALRPERLQAGPEALEFEAALLGGLLRRIRTAREAFDVLAQDAGIGLIDLLLPFSQGLVEPVLAGTQLQQLVLGLLFARLAIRALQLAVEPAPLGPGTLQRLRGEQERTAEARLVGLGRLEGHLGSVELRLGPGHREAVLLRFGKGPDPFAEILPARLRELLSTRQRLEAEGLQKRYGARLVVKDVHLAVHSGEVVGLLGPNGAGKTTSFYMLVGLVRADAGQIRIDGERVEQLPIHQRARLGLSYLPQEASIFRRLTVEENIRAVLELQQDADGRSLGRRAIDEQLGALLADLSIERLRDSPAPALSGGERRRVEIARALATQPRFILLDEPFAGVDPIAVLEIQRIIGFLKARQIGVLITDHNVRETLGICDRAYIISEGRVLAEGEPAAIVENPQVRKVYLGEHFRM